MLELAHDLVAAEKDVDPLTERERAEAALTELFNEAKNADTSIIVKHVVADIDALVEPARFVGWQNTTNGEREMQQALRAVLYIKYQIKDQEVFDKAYAYIKQYYPDK